MPRSQKHTRARFLLLLIWCCCIIAVGCGTTTTTTTTAAYVALSSLVTCNEKTKKRKKNLPTKMNKKNETRVFVDTKRNESQKRTPVVRVLVLVAGKTRNNEKMKKRDKNKKNVTKSKETKEIREGSFPQQLIFSSAITD